MILYFYRADLYESYAQAFHQGGRRTICGLSSQDGRLYDACGDLADTLEAISVTAEMMAGSGQIKFVLFDDDGTFLDAC